MCGLVYVFDFSTEHSLVSLHLHQCSFKTKARKLSSLVLLNMIMSQILFGCNWFGSSQISCFRFVLGIIYYTFASDFGDIVNVLLLTSMGKPYTRASLDLVGLLCKLGKPIDFMVGGMLCALMLTNKNKCMSSSILPS